MYTAIHFQSTVRRQGNPDRVSQKCPLKIEERYREFNKKGRFVRRLRSYFQGQGTRWKRWERSAGQVDSYSPIPTVLISQSITMGRPSWESSQVVHRHFEVVRARLLQGQGRIVIESILNSEYLLKFYFLLILHLLVVINVCTGKHTCLVLLGYLSNSNHIKCLYQVFIH